MSWQSVYQSGDYEIDLARREVRSGGVPVPVGSRDFAVIEALVQSAGALITKKQLMDRVWPGMIVEENTLQAHISAVRKALGPYRELLKTEAGRGYRFLGNWTVRHKGASAVTVNHEAAQTPTQEYQTNLPETALGLVGRTAVAQQLHHLLSAHRLVTLTGPGGIGKTVLAQEVARNVFPRIGADAWFAGLASLSDPKLVPSVVAGVLGLKLGGHISAEAVARAIGTNRVLLILDNCEHLIDTSAELMETVVRRCPGAIVLTTSREILRVEGEYVYWVPPLDVPPPDQNDPDILVKHSAVELFIARTQALNSDFSPHRDDFLSIASICRHLDGIPLAIEFAAARAATLALPEVEARLENRFALLTRGRRTALPRHQTLHATLDWSYELLPAGERLLLRRLAIFSAGFTLEAAVAVAGDSGTATVAVAEGTANLFAKSLVTRDASIATGRWQLLETVRAYALEKLTESGETQQIARRHAQFFRNLLTIVSPSLQSQKAGENIARYGPEIDNVRTALTWAFSPTGDVVLGVALAAVATDFWIALSLLSECCEWGLKAVAQLGAAEGTRDEMMLQSGLGKALTYSRGMQLEAKLALTRALELAETLQDDNYQFRAAYAMCLFALRVLDFRECLVLARKCELLALRLGDPTASAIADFAFGMSRYFLGEHAAAAANLARACATYPVAMRSADPIRLGADFLTCSLCYQAMTFWSLGFVDRAFRAGRDAVKEARSINHPVALCTALAVHSGILLVKMGYLEAAERCIDELIDHSEKHSLIPFHALGLCSKGSLMAARTDLNVAERLLRLGLQRSREVGYYLFDPFFEAELAAVLASTERIEEGIVEINTALRNAEESESLWCMPEILRIKGELIAKSKGPERNAAEDWFTRSCKLASQQKALSWELRSATSLARFWRDQECAVEAREFLGGVYRRFTEGFETADLQAAKGLLQQLL